MRDKLVLGPAVDLQHPKRLAVPLQYDVHGAADAVLHEQFGGSKPLFILKVIRDDGFSGPQREPRGRSEIGANRREADYARLPSNSRTNQKAIFGWIVLQHFAEFGLHSLGRQSRGVVQKLIEARALQRRHTELCQYFLLPDAPLEGL